MTIQMLKYLVVAVDSGSLRAASERLDVTQPTISSQLAKLESDLDQTLIERGRHGVRPTPIGQLVVNHARIVLREAELLRAACRPSVHPLAGALHLGVIPTVGTYVLPALLPALRQHYPQTLLHLNDSVTNELIQGIKEATLDAALLSLPLNDSALAYETILEEPFFALVPTNHELAQQETIQRKDLLRADLLLLAEGHCLREQTLSFCKLPAPNRVIQATSVESLRLMVAAGLGCTILPRMAVTGRYARHAGVVVRPFAPPVPTRRVVLAWRHSYHAFGEMQRLAKRFADAVDALSSTP